MSITTAAGYTQLVSDLVLDAARSRVQIHTFAGGVLARLAHDLALVCIELSGTASRGPDAASATTGTASIEVPLRGLQVAGILTKDGRIDESGLSPSERRDCLAKMHKDVFQAGSDDVVRIEAHLIGSSARVRVVPPNGQAVEIIVHPDLRNEDDGLRATGDFEVSLAAIGSDVVKGPMGAFRVKDGVRILFDVLFMPA